MGCLGIEETGKYYPELFRWVSGKNRLIIRLIIDNSGFSNLRDNLSYSEFGIRKIKPR
jgi:hypothetical protein